MALDNCKSAIEGAIGRELTEREKGIVSRKALELKAKIDLASNDPTATDGILRSFADDVKASALIAKRNTALNWRAFSSLKAWRQVVGPKVKNPGEVLNGLVRGSLFNFDGAKSSLANLATKESNNRVGALLADLEKGKLTDYAFSGTDDQNIVGAQHDLRNGTQPDHAKYGKNAVDVATLLEKHQEALRLDQNRAGAWIAKNGDRLFRRTHDAMKIAKAGDNQWGSDESRAAWTKFTGDRMDWTKAFDGELGAADAATRQKRLDSLFTQFTADTHVNWDSNASVSGVGSRNFGKKVSYGRELVFKSPAADLEYQRAFGRGSSVAENVWNNLSTGGRDLAIMQRMGPNPRETLDRFVNDWKKELTANNDSKGLKQLDDRYQRILKNDWRLLTENTGHPATNFVGRFASSVRHTTNTAALGMSIFSVPGDLALKSSVMAQQGGSFMAELGKATAAMVTGSGLSEDAQRTLAAEAGIRIEGAHLPLDPNMVDHVGFGQMARWNQMVMSVTGHSWWTNRIRTNSLVADAFRHWTMRDKAYADLPGGMQSALKQFGIDDKGWDVLRSSQAETLDNGMQAFLPSNIAERDIGDFKSIAGASDSQLTRARQTLANNYRNLLGEMADRSTSSPSIANRAFMGLGMHDAGTWQGELWRGALQLKGFMMNYMRNHLGRELAGYSEEYKSFPALLADAMRGKNPKALAGIAKLVAGGVGIGYITNALRDIATGKTPQDPTSGMAAARAFARQSFGLYSDFLFHQGQPNESFWDKVGESTGPEFGLLADAFNQSAKIGQQIASPNGITPEQQGRDFQRFFGTAYRNTPGTNLFWNKWAMDYFVLNNLSETINPGYKQRLMQNAAKRGQSYILGSPSP